jgi:dTMP kinase
MTQKRLIVIDGLDGSGKETQTDLLVKRLSAKTLKPVIRISYPDYESPSSALVKMYLSGEIGEIDQVNVYAASSFYSLDRYIGYFKNWKKHYDAGCYIIADRYTTSNIIYQMPKLDESERSKYIQWLFDFEFGLLDLPRPDKVIYLDMHPEISQKLLEKRYMGNTAKKDIHERNLQYLCRCRHSALKAAELMGWVVVKCYDDDNKPYRMEHISDLIWDGLFNRESNETGESTLDDRF